MSEPLTFTGERFVPGIEGEIVYEHVHRYAFARRYATGRRVLDVACGEGYGSAILAAEAASVTGVDIDAATVAHARATYASRANLAFVEGSAAKLPLADASFDLVVSFETIEHLEAGDQPKMLAEIARVLAPDGALVLSAPNRPEYSESRGYVNPYHRHEHDRAELERLLDAHFPARRWHAQRVWLGSTLWREGGGTDAEAFAGSAADVERAGVPPAMYFVVVASRRAAALPAPAPAISLYSDAGETELKRAAAAAAEAIRLDALLRDRERIVVERDGQLAKAHAHVAHLERLVAERDGQLAAAGARAPALEALVAERERLVAERDATLAATNAHVLHLEGLVAAREAAIAQRDALLGGANAQVKHLEGLVAFRERLVVERDAQLAASQRRVAEIERLQADTREALSSAQRRIADVEAECSRLDRALAAQERIIAYRQTFRWWLLLPFKRARLAWKRLTGA